MNFIFQLYFQKSSTDGLGYVVTSLTCFCGSFAKIFQLLAIYTFKYFEFFGYFELSVCKTCMHLLHTTHTINSGAAKLCRVHSMAQSACVIMGRHLHPHSPLCTFRNNISKLFQVETRASVNISKNTANISWIWDSNC